MFNSGQSCCAIEVRAVLWVGLLRLTYSRLQRIYVHEDVYDEFVKKFVELTKVGIISSMSFGTF